MTKDSDFRCTRDVGGTPSRRFGTVLATIVLLFSHCGVAGAGETMSPGAEIPLTAGWSFYRFPRNARFDPGALPEKGWEAVTLPHTARVEQRLVNDQWQGDALYRLNLGALPAWQDKAIWMRFEGAMMVADVYLNGSRIFRHQGGFLPFTLDLSNRLIIGERNEVLVHLDNRDNPLTGPKPLSQLDFNMYGGLYREVRLFIRDRLHITDEMLAREVTGGGIFVTYPQVSARRARLSVKTHVANTGSTSRKMTVRHLLRDERGLAAQLASRPLTLKPGGDLYHLAELEVDQPRLWSPRSPHLYRLETRIEEDGQTVDARHTPVGIRRLAIERDGFRINGEKMFLRGVNRHQEYPYVGYAISPQADYRDALLIKRAGFDYVRLSHYPHSRHFMAAADELGLLLLDAILGWQFYNPDPAFSDHVVDSCRRMIRRDRNHPSVLAWECSLNESAMPDALVARLHAAVHEEFPGGQAWSAGWLAEGYDIFIQARQHRLQHYEPPDRPYIVSEYGDWEYYAQNAGLNQDAWADLAPEARTSRQLLGSGERRLLQQATNIQEAHNDNLGTPAFADGYWVMFDYNRGYAEDLEASGIMSIDRVAKPAYYFFRSQRPPDESSEYGEAGPMVHIATWWTPESPARVRVFSNTGEVELKLNGRPVGRKRADEDALSTRLSHPPFTFDLGAFEPGTLEAVGYIAGQPVARHRVTTPGVADRLELRLADHGVAAAAHDLVFVRAEVVDSEGNTVPENGRRVGLALNCPERAVVVGSASAATEAGIASFLIRVRAPGHECRAEATSGRLVGGAVLRF